jgi:radical SAM superfamily enzyme
MKYAEHVVIHRLPATAEEKSIAPLWSADKKRVLADLNVFEPARIKQHRISMLLFKQRKNTHRGLFCRY